jgi:hypothetical protein
VADAEYGFERAYLAAPGTTLTIGPDIVARTGSGNFEVGTRNADVNGNAAYVVNRGTLVAGTWLGAGKAVGLTRVTNEGLVQAAGGSVHGYAVDNRGRIEVSAGGSATLDTFTNNGAVTVDGGASLTVLGLDNRGTIEVTGGRFTASAASAYGGGPPLWNPGRITLRDTTAGAAGPDDDGRAGADVRARGRQAAGRRGDAG